MNVKCDKSSRKIFNRSGVDKTTLEYMYIDLVLPIQAIADKCGKTRQRVWQLLKEYGLHNKNRIARKCIGCGVNFEVVRSRVRIGGGKYHSEQCYHDHRASLGYDPSRQGQRIGRKVIEDYLGFALPIGFIVHHEDGNQSHNEIENLWVFPSQSEHLKYHHAKRAGNGALPYQELWELPSKIEEWLNQ